jgi:two-component system, NarL family, nitrate/nitrite response regulator NarL
LRDWELEVDNSFLGYQLPSMSLRARAAKLALMAIRCIIVDDNPEFLAAARPLLERGGLDVVDVVSTGQETLESVARLRPDVVVIDLFLDDESGFDVARRLAEMDPDATRVILISTYDHQDVPELLAASPAVRFVSKADLSAEAVLSILGVTGDDG